MADRFQWEETHARLRRKPRVASIRYGEGYSARIPLGLNVDLQVWDIGFDDYDVTLGDAIEDFLIAKARTGESFLWQTPRGQDLLVTCAGIDRDEDGNRRSLTATFEEVMR